MIGIDRSPLCQESTIADPREVRLFGIVMAINFPLYWIIWHGGDYPILDTVLRLTAMVLCLGLIVLTYRRPSGWYKAYWYGTVTFCLPFFFTFMTLRYHGSALWLMNCMSALFFGLMVMSVPAFFMTLVVGVLGAWSAAWYLLPPFALELGTVDGYGLFWTFFAVVVIGGLFSHRREQVHGEKLRTLQTFGSTVAHEMRRPLQMIRTMTRELSHLIQKYAGGNKPLVPVDAEYMGEFVDDLAILTDRASHSVDIILSNVAEDLDRRPLSVLSMSRCVADAVASYPLVGDEADHITILGGDDFTFRGHGDLVRQIFFNLLQNSLQFINDTGKGTITIDQRRSPGGNQVLFTDTSVGVRPSFLPKIFDPFEADRPHGTGIGLSFCRRAMDAMGGTITCDSVLGEYTTFVLTFPND